MKKEKVENIERNINSRETEIIKDCNLKDKLIVSICLFIFVVTFSCSLKSQPILSQPYNPLNFGTGRFNNALQTLGGADGSWNVAGTPAIVMNPNIGCFWAGNGANSQWITASNMNCFGLIGNYTCNPSAAMDIYYTYTFNLNQPNPVFQINWQVFAYGWVQDIKVNANTAYDSHVIGYNHNFNQYQFGFTFSWCWGWQTGLNTIVIHVRNNPSTTNIVCPYTGIQVVSWGPAPMAYPFISGNPTTCAAQQYTFTVPSKTTLGMPTASTFSWSKPSTAWSSSSNTNILVTTAGPSGGLIGMSAYSVSPNGPYCYATALYSVTVPPQITVTPVNTTICQGTPLNLTATGGISYNWYQVGFGYIGSGPSMPVAPVSSLSPITYYAAGLTASGCTYTKSAVVNALALPTVQIASFPTTICSGQPITLSVTPFFGTSYVWQQPPSLLNHPDPYTIIPNGTSTFKAIGTAANHCTNSAMVTISVNPTPTVSINISPPVVCLGQSVTLKALGANSYFWLPGGPSTQIVTLSNLQSNITFSVVGTTNGCTNTAIGTASIINNPVIAVFPQNAVCPGVTNTIVASGATNYTFNVVSCGNSSIQISPNPSFVITPSCPVSYTICGSPLNSTCTACQSGSFGFAPIVPIVANNATLCTNGGPSITLTVSSTFSAPVNFTWSTGATGSLCNVSPTTTTVYTVNAGSTSGCPNSYAYKVDVQDNCCPQSTTCLTPLLGALQGTYANVSYILNNTITTNQDTWFSNMDIWMTPNSKIIVKNGTTLDLDKTHLFACGLNMWEGIEVQDGGRITTSVFNTRFSNSMIEDAKVAIKIDQLNQPSYGINPPIDVQRIIFNRNFIGIQISNSVPVLNSLQLGISGCIFSSRHMTFATCPNQISWPSSDFLCVLNGLRCPTNPTTGLTSPYTFSGNSYNFPQVNLKQPFQNQPGHIGIQIQNVGDVNAPNAFSGVEFGGSLYLAVTKDDFNLFDGLGVGIEVIDASLTTSCNVFQNMQNYPYNIPIAGGTYGGQGIKHVITGDMNARLSLKGNITLEEGNRFWNCPTGIFASNVYEFWNNLSIFRSTHSATLPISLAPLPGDTGISLYTNRFNFSVRNSQFNNIKNGIYFNTQTPTYNYNLTNAGLTPGIFAVGLSIEENYFGAQVTSTTPYSSGSANTSEYMSDAIKIETPNLTGWSFNNNMSGSSNNGFSDITSNKIDRSFRGIYVDGMESTDLQISGNVINIEDDQTFTTSIQPSYATGWGIATKNSIDNLQIASNTIQANYCNNSLNDRIVAVYSENNLGFTFPLIECNQEKSSYYGFQFHGQNPNTNWRGNVLCDNFGGLVLTGSAVIGAQGSSSDGTGNRWVNNCSSWGSGITLFQTYVDQSDPNLSPLFCNSPNSIFTPNPLNHGNTPGSNPYMYFPNMSILTATNNPYGDCWQNTPYIQPPQWKGMNQNTALNANANFGMLDGIIIFPIPAQEKLIIKNLGVLINYTIKLFDISGKEIELSETKSEETTNVDLTLITNGMYFIEINSELGQKKTFKIVVAK